MLNHYKAKQSWQQKFTYKMTGQQIQDCWILTKFFEIQNDLLNKVGGAAICNNGLQSVKSMHKNQYKWIWTTKSTGIGIHYITIITYTINYYTKSIYLKLKKFQK